MFWIGIFGDWGKVFMSCGMLFCSWSCFVGEMGCGVNMGVWEWLMIELILVLVRFCRLLVFIVCIVRFFLWFWDVGLFICKGWRKWLFVFVVGRFERYVFEWFMLFFDVVNLFCVFVLMILFDDFFIDVSL